MFVHLWNFSVRFEKTVVIFKVVFNWDSFVFILCVTYIYIFINYNMQMMYYDVFVIFV